jgi:hypothetical protein
MKAIAKHRCQGVALKRQVAHDAKDNINAG